MPIDKVAEDELRLATSRDAVKSSIETRVHAEIAGEAVTHTAEGHTRVAEVAGRLRDRAIDETLQGERRVGQARAAARGSQFLDYGFSVLYALLALRLVLALIGARSASGFVQFVRTVTDPFYAPFRGIVSSPTADGGVTLVLPIVIALAAYALLHAASNGLLRLVGQRKTTI